MEPTNVEKVRALPWSISGYVSTAVFNNFTFFGSAFVLFLSAMGFVSSQIGFLLSLLSFIGGLAMFSSPLIVRLGYKRAFLLFWTTRNLIAGLMMLAPWVLAGYGLGAAFAFTAAVVVLFALLRSVSETALMAWQQEFVPSAIQGKFFAVSNTFMSLAAIVAVSAGGYIIDQSQGLNGFIILFGAGVAFGLVSTVLFSRVPGGARPTGPDSGAASLAGILAALRDRSFTRFMAGVGTMLLATVPLASFLPVFLTEKSGLSAAQTVFLQTGHMLPALLASFLWGWTADRYGAKPIILWGIYVIAGLPILWFILPRETDLTFALAMGFTLLQGLAHSAWAVGLTRLFYVSMVPADKKADYMALYYTMLSLSIGLSALAGGWLLQAARGLDGRLGAFMIDAYSPLFLVSLLLPMLGAWLFSGVRSDGGLSTRQMADLFMRGNVFLAVESLISFRSARDERATVATTARMGQADSPLTVHELLEALKDPRFNVRFEAIVSIARRGPDEQLLAALTRVLHGADPALSVAAAWAMGRVGDRRAIAPLQLGLDSSYRSVQAHCARALGTLSDKASAPSLLARLEAEHDPGLQIALASALGTLRHAAAVPRLLDLLAASDDEATQKELALALARILGDEKFFIQLFRQMEQEPGADLSRALTTLARRLRKPGPAHAGLPAPLSAAAAAFAREDLPAGAAHLAHAARLASDAAPNAASRAVLLACAEQLDAIGAARIETLVLALHALNYGLPAAKEPAGPQPLS